MYDGWGWHGGAQSPGLRFDLSESGQIERIEHGEPRAGDQCFDTLMPGAVNPHVHLELGPLAKSPGHFVDWLRSVIEARFAPGAEDPSLIAERNLSEALGFGYTSFCEIDSVGAGAAALAGRGLRARSDLELIGFDQDSLAAAANCDRRLATAQDALEIGLSPHAPYSVSAALFAEAGRRKLPLSIHVAESPEECEFLRTGTGPFRVLLEELGRMPPSWEPSGLLPTMELDRHGLLGPRTLLVHMQEAEASELELAARRGAALALCPGTIEYFGRSAPPLGRMLELGLRVVLGTDSLASNERLDPRSELRRATQLFPDLSAAQLLPMCFAGAGAALSLPVGRLAPACVFDAIALPGVAPLAEGPRAASEWFIHSDAPITAIWCAGRRLWGS
ncbi:MAG: hypothetical protein CSA62_03425 [Planctomycetota bacterium]|nr:MAG: hypothetical protein CSA62_03425 [Planctomycetota bacterium]